MARTYRNSWRHSRLSANRPRLRKTDPHPGRTAAVLRPAPFADPLAEGPVQALGDESVADQRRRPPATDRGSIRSIDGRVRATRRQEPDVPIAKSESLRQAP